jgi:molybdenum cofactor cytidylyltransferase
VKQLAGIVLAAGRSTRFGSNKLLADLGGKPVVRHVVETAISGGLSPVIVIVGHQSERVSEALLGLDVRILKNSNFADGMSTSLRLGATSVPPGCSGVMILLGDMPRVQSETIQALAEQFVSKPGSCDAVIPSYNNRRGNPVVLSARMLQRLDTLSGDNGARAILDGRNVSVFKVPDPGILMDTDTPHALEIIRKAHKK